MWCLSLNEEFEYTWHLGFSKQYQYTPHATHIKRGINICPRQSVSLLVHSVWERDASNFFLTKCWVGTQQYNSAGNHDPRRRLPFLSQRLRVGLPSSPESPNAEHFGSKVAVMREHPVQTTLHSVMLAPEAIENLCFAAVASISKFNLKLDLILMKAMAKGSRYVASQCPSPVAP